MRFFSLFVVRCVANSTSGGTRDQTIFVAALGGVPALCTMLGVPDPKINMVALEGLRNFLQVGQQVADNAAAADSDPVENPYAIQVEQCGGLDKLEALQQHGNNDVYQITVEILETYFLTEGEEEQDQEGDGATSESSTDA